MSEKIFGFYIKGDLQNLLQSTSQKVICKNFLHGLPVLQDADLKVPQDYKFYPFDFVRIAILVEFLAQYYEKYFNKTRRKEFTKKRNIIITCLTHLLQNIPGKYSLLARKLNYNHTTVLYHSNNGNWLLDKYTGRKSFVYNQELYEIYKETFEEMSLLIIRFLQKEDPTSEGNREYYLSQVYLTTILNKLSDFKENHNGMSVETLIQKSKEWIEELQKHVTVLERKSGVSV